MRRALAVGLVQAVWAAGLVAGGGSAAPAAAQENPFTTSVDVRMGERLFRAQCGRCHGRDGTGNDETGAPDLTTGTFANASSDAGLFDVIRDGIDGTAMIGISPRASDQTVWQIISYVNSLNLDPEDYDLPGDVRAGRQIYAGKGNCANCHMVDGVGGRLGPDLSTVANRRDPDELRSDLLAPDEEVAPRWWTIRVTRADGSVVEYSNGQLTAQEVAAAQPRLMDCVDCHHRPTHIFRQPDRALDEALVAGRIDASLPFVKKAALDALTEVGSSLGEAEQVGEQIRAFYREQQPSLFESRSEDIEAAVKEAVEIYRLNVFPEMKVTWGTYPDHIGHMTFPGCFRCHDGEHESADGRSISQDCASCHAILAWDEENPEILQTLGSP